MMALATTTATAAQQGTNENTVDVSKKADAAGGQGDVDGIRNGVSGDNAEMTLSINPSTSPREQQQEKQIVDFQSLSHPKNLYITTSSSMIDEEEKEGKAFHYQQSSSRADNVYHNTECNNYESGANSKSIARDAHNAVSSTSPKIRIVMDPIHTNYDFESATGTTTRSTELTRTKSRNVNSIYASAEMKYHDQEGAPLPSSQHQPKHQQNQATSLSSPALPAGGGNLHDINNERVLPPELRRIFEEVARTGTCSYLPWNNSYPNMNGGEGDAWEGRDNNNRTTSHSGGSGQYYDSLKKRQGGLKRNHLYQQLQALRNSSAIGYTANGVKSLLSSSSLMDTDDDSGRTGILDRHNQARRRHHRHHFKRHVLDSSSSAVVKNGNNDRPSSNILFINNEGACEDNPFGSPSKNQGDYSETVPKRIYKKMPHETEGVMDCHPSGHRLAAAFSDYSYTNTNTDRKRRRPHHRDAVCWSSCSGSISSMGGASVVSSVRSSSPPSTPPAAPSTPPAAPLTSQYGTLQCAMQIAAELVLNHSYMYRDGYKVSIAEERMLDRERQQKERMLDRERQQNTILTRVNANRRGRNGNAWFNVSKDSTAPNPAVISSPSSSEAAFVKRKGQLIKMLGGGISGNNPSSSLSGICSLLPLSSDGPITKNNEEIRAIVNSRKLFALRTGQATSSSSTLAGTTLNTWIADTSDASVDSGSRKTNKRENISRRITHVVSDFESGPPFTIQRFAEVLLEPERYYTQTHKLCNALEKLLLVKSSSTAFGGFTGGNTSQNQREEREVAAWLDEKGRVESEERERQHILKRRMLSTPVDNTDPVLQMNVRVETIPKSKRSTNRNNSSQSLNFSLSNDPFASQSSTTSSSDSEHGQINSAQLLHDGMMMGVSMDDLESTTRAASGQKFVPVHIDQSHDRIYANAAIDGNATKSTPNSFPPVSLLTEDGESNGRQIRASLSKDSLSEKVTLALQGQKEPVLSSNITQHLGVDRPLSPIVFSPTVNLLNGHHHQSDTENHGHHSVGLEAATGIDGHKMEMEILIDSSRAGSSSSSGGHNGVGGSVIADLEKVEQGRSSASNSDADSDTDISLDDSTSDRSDGSDSGSCTGISEPFTAARVMALNQINRMNQQQHRREQYLQNRALGQSYTSGINSLPPSDVEYQSGDSIDSLMAEDSGGSDSSSSDFAD